MNTIEQYLGVAQLLWSFWYLKAAVAFLFRILPISWQQMPFMNNSFTFIYISKCHLWQKQLDLRPIYISLVIRLPS